MNKASKQSASSCQDRRSDPCRPSHPTPEPNDAFASPPPAHFWEAFAFWLKLGFISFGGPADHRPIVGLHYLWRSARHCHRFSGGASYRLARPEEQAVVGYRHGLLRRYPCRECAVSGRCGGHGASIYQYKTWKKSRRVDRPVCTHR